MSFWTYITGSITVSPGGRTQAEKRYILDTILAHLPKVTGSERNMDVHVVQRSGYSSWSSVNEFDEPLSKEDRREQDNYILVIDAQLRDRVYYETFKEFNKWLNRLAKRLWIKDICVKLYDDYPGQTHMYTDPEPYAGMQEDFSWANDTGEPAWSEYLFWDRMKDSFYPMKLAYKYMRDIENDAEVKRRINYYSDENFED